MKYLSGIILATWVVAVLSSPDLSGFQTRRQARVSGTLRLPSGESEAPGIVEVTLSTPAGAFVDRRTLSSETSFTFNRVAYGEYVITVESAGFETTSQDFDVEGPYRDVMVIVNLGPRIKSDQPNEGREGRTVTVRALSLPPAALREFQKGESEAKKGNSEKAVGHFRKVLETSPEYHPALEALGMQYAALQRWEEGIQALEKSIEYHPDNARARRNLAQFYLTQSNYSAAVDHLNAAAVIEPNRSKTWMLLGESYLGLGDCVTALDYFLTAAEIDENDRSYLGIGQCYLRTGKISEALAEFREFLAQNPKDPRAESVRQLVSRVEVDLASKP